MAEPIRRRPDILVLGVGGTLGEAWMRGVLSGIESVADVDFRRCEYYVGSSAGSIVAATLAAGRRPEAGDRAARAWGEAAHEPDDASRATTRAAAAAARIGTAAVGPLAPLALGGIAPAGRMVRAAALTAVPRGGRQLSRVQRYVDGLGATFDGRLRIAAVDRRSGRRVMFGRPSAPKATVGEAVLASCAVPGVFAPVRIGDREYVDGGVWSPTNLDAAPAGRGVQVLCLVPTAAVGRARGPLGALRAFTSTALAAETLVLRSRGASVRSILPDTASAAVMGVNLMDPRPSERVLDAAFAQGRALASG
jgi:NTE family protein